MKHFTFSKITLLAALALLLSTTKSEAQSGAAKTKLTGIAAEAGTEFMLFRYRDKLDTIHLDSLGNFNFEFQLATPEECKILVGKSPLKIFLQPGDELRCEFNAAKPEPPKFTGKNAAYTLFYDDWKKNEMKLSRFANPKIQATKTPTQILHVADSLKGVRTAFVSQACATSGLNAAFGAYQQKAAEYLCLAEVASYRASSPQMKTSASAEDIKSVDIALAAVQVDNLELLYNDYYQQYTRNLVTGSVSKQLVLTGPEQLPQYYMMQFDEMLKLLQNQEVRNYMLKELVVEAIKETGTRDIKELVNRFNQTCTNEPMKKRVNKVWAPYEKMQKGQPCPVSENYNMAGELMLMSDLKGKVVYVDIWATWCGPCKREIPELKKLEEEYHGKNVEFVSISTDKNVDQWKAFVVEQQLGGMQLHQSDNVDLTISKNFMANSIPRFILLNEEGQIVSADAPRPSSGTQIRSLIDGVLND